MEVVFDIPRRYNLTNLGSTDSYSLSFPFFSLLPELKSGCCIKDVPFGSGLKTSAFWLVLTFCNYLLLFQKEVSLIQGEESHVIRTDM